MTDESDHNPDDDEFDSSDLEAPADVMLESFLSRADAFVEEGFDVGDVIAAMTMALADFATFLRTDAPRLDFDGEEGETSDE